MESVNKFNYLSTPYMRQKTINLSPFEAHLGENNNTPLSKNATEPDPNALKYKPIFNKIIDMKTLRWGELISDELWDDDRRSDVEFEKQRHKISKDARLRCNEDQDKKSRTRSHPDVGLLVPAQRHL